MTNSRYDIERNVVDSQAFPRYREIIFEMLDDVDRGLGRDTAAGPRFRQALLLRQGSTSSPTYPVARKDVDDRRRIGHLSRYDGKFAISVSFMRCVEFLYTDK